MGGRGWRSLIRGDFTDHSLIAFLKSPKPPLCDLNGCFKVHCDYGMVFMVLMLLFLLPERKSERVSRCVTPQSEADRFRILSVKG